ncbi:MAG: hypothetical protein HYU53_18695 [Acidobacteria bacterium]|nr:hypothetical protein [Acidobacteriota bacterium]
MERCPACGSSRVYPSRRRSAGERLRHLLTGKQPYRCHQCEWRGWAAVTLRPRDRDETLPDELRTSGPHATVKPAELDQLDPR